MQTSQGPGAEELSGLAKLKSYGLGLPLPAAAAAAPCGCQRKGGARKEKRAANRERGERDEARRARKNWSEERATKREKQGEREETLETMRAKKTPGANPREGRRSSAGAHGRKHREGVRSGIAKTHTVQHF